MITTSTLVTFCWIIFLLYWFVNWNTVKQTKEIAWRSQRTGWIIAWILLIAYFFSPWGNNTFLSTTDVTALSFFKAPLFQILGAILTVIGLIIAIIARKTLADNWSGNVELKKNHELITRGVYRYARHPIYTGVCLMALGSLIVDHALISVALLLIIVIFLVYKFKKEEELLLKHFPKEYPAYMKKTKALIPFIY